MTSTLQVQNLQGPTSGANTNQVLLGSGQKIIATDQGSVVAPGMVMQVIQNTSNSLVNTSSNNFLNTGFSVSITPTSSTSKILLTLNVFLTIVNGGQVALNIYSSADSAFVTSLSNGFGGIYNAGGSSFESIQSINFLTDVVGSTTSRTYSLWGKSTGTDPAYFLNYTRLSTFTAMEIAQ